MSGEEIPVSLLSRVFISYAHDDAAHEERVRKLWVFLRKHGIDAHIDLSAAEQPQDWPSWMRSQLRAARFVLLIASPAYRQRAEGDASPDVGRGVRWEAGLIRDEFYADPDAARRRFLPVVLPGGSADHIPDWVGRASGTHYNVASYTVKGSERLLRLLTDQPHEVEPPLGEVPLLPKRGAGAPAIRGDLQVAGLVRRMANRSPDRDETMVQADVRQLLLMGHLGLDEHSLGAEATTRPDDRRRIVVERGATIIEVRSDLRKRGVLQTAERELSVAVEARTRLTGHRYAALLTDGADWRLYHHNGDGIDAVAELTVDTGRSDTSHLLSWIEAVLATGSQIEPSPAQISRKLGADSPAHAYDVAELSAIYNRFRHLPTVQVKRSLWGRLLKTAQGTNFTDDDELFINHTLLVIMAEVIGHAVLGIDLDEPGLDAAAIMSGVRFFDAQVRGVVEADFFDWVAEVPGGEQFVMSLVGRLTRFAWDRVEHDVMKILYESIISRESRHLLGEYYTPGWLADEVIASTIDEPLSQRVLDASCGSGTFLFHAIRHYLAAADAAGLDGPQSIRGVASHVFGVDVHPVAVTLARVTYLLAIGEARLRASDRPPLSVPVYLGDSLQWGQESTLLSYAGLGVPIDSDFELFTDRLDVADQLRFPDSVIADAEQFDLLVSELARMATRRARGARIPSLSRIFRGFAIKDEDQPTLRETFKRMCELHDAEKNHIWGYYVRNLARPVWFARQDNQVDILIGNPPWLSYRFMTEPQKRTFRAMSKERGQWAGAALATHQDLSALFVSRCIELYLKPGGRFSYVMPGALLSRGQYAGFRSGRLGGPEFEVNVSFDRAWDLHQIKPAFFKVPACVVRGQRRRARRVRLR
ncbi:N-6 DNA methylase [Kribbella sp. NPDC056345]|uniref:N-6 DNA methylase n=1 Tax=Kribbella sp. NPDC056345 TaxID=3345789 RepID=UPI0035E1627A